jgi:hypothetical protein
MSKRSAIRGLSYDNWDCIDWQPPPLVAKRKEHEVNGIIPSSHYGDMFVHSPSYSSQTHDRKRLLYLEIGRAASHFYTNPRGNSQISRC